MNFLAKMLLLCCFLGVLPSGAQAQDMRSWWDKQQLTPATKDALMVQWSSCCEKADGCCPTCKWKCEFRIAPKYPYENEWWFKDESGAWAKIPRYTYHYVDSTPTGGPVLFRYQYHDRVIPYGAPICLKIPRPRG